MSSLLNSEALHGTQMMSLNFATSLVEDLGRSLDDGLHLPTDDESLVDEDDESESTRRVAMANEDVELADLSGGRQIDRMALTSTMRQRQLLKLLNAGGRGEGQYIVKRAGRRLGQSATLYADVYLWGPALSRLEVVDDKQSDR
ncbi:uncharacterized protein FIBRA_06333 [Fibroporia radiculosa]|uniref:Uncharacterized protein n=1 Tax=Fibroporia radiculosa TaxID=599839 RepID=J4IB75_9APHY|nr:uncharacterized protein FIBRA_06333 [Fibroporia radiculosa]CCM04171.1 predicted protein [Fibroporia radiculosa]